MDDDAWGGLYAAVQQPSCNDSDEYNDTSFMAVGVALLLQLIVHAMLDGQPVIQTSHQKQ